MRQTDAHYPAGADPSGVRWLLIQSGCVMLAAAPFGLIASLPLVRGGVVRSAAQLAEIVGLHLLLGLAVGLPAALVAHGILGRLPVGRRAGWRRWASVLPVWATLLVLLGTVVNVALLPALLSLASLAGNAALLAVAVGVAAAWVYRPWGGTVDRRLAAWCTALVLLAAAALAAMLAGGGVQPTVKGRPAADAPDIFLVLIDSLRPDYLGCYGDRRGASPALDAQAAVGVVFERAYSASNWTRPAIASLFSSSLPSRHQVVTQRRALSPRVPLLAETLAAAGYDTAFFTTGTNVEPADGYDRGVDHFYFQRGRRPIALTLLGRHLLGAALPALGRRHAAEAVPLERSAPADLTDRVMAWAAGRDRRRPGFVYLHYPGPHDPYAPPAEFDRFAAGARRPSSLEPPARRRWEEPLPAELRRRMIELYLGEILWHDAELGRLVDGLGRLGYLDNAALFVTSDHGEAFGEHRLWGHGQGMFDVLVRVPLVFRRFPRGPTGRVAEPVSLIDLAATIAELAGADPPASFDGATLRLWWEGSAPADRLVFIENPETGEAAVHGRDWSYLEATAPDGLRWWLFRGDDREQRRELSAEHPEVADRLRRLLHRRRELDRAQSFGSREIELDAQRHEQLRGLGYLE